MLAVVGLGVLATSCDEGRLVTGPGGVLEAEIQEITGQSSIIAGEDVQFSTSILLSNGAEVTDDAAVKWTADPASAVTFPDGDDDYTVTVRGRAPAAKVTLSARVNHPLLQAETKTFDVEVTILGVEATRPSDGDTTITALGSAITLRARGLGDGGASVDSGGVTWAHSGSAVQVLSHVGRDTLRVQAQAVGTDTFVVARAAQCAGKCADTVVVRVQPVPARVEVPAQIELDALGDTKAIAATVYDANDNVIPGAAVAYALVTPDDSVTATVTTAGTVTARGNGTASVRATAGTATATTTVEVTQSVESVDLPAAAELTAFGATGTLAATVSDPGGSPLERDFAVTWTSRATGKVTVTPSATETAEATIAAVAAGSAWVVAESEGRRDSTLVTVSQTPAAVTLDPASGTIDAIGAELQLTAVVEDANGNAIATPAVTWSTDGAGVATVDVDGVVTAVAVGTANITATSGDASAAAAIEVRQVPAAVVVTETLELDAIGAVGTLTATVTDAGGTGIPAPGLTWSVIDGSGTAATVNTTGDVTAVANGQVRIEALSGDVADTALVTVTQAVDTLTLDSSAVSFASLQLGKTVVVTAKDPGNTVVDRDYDVAWSTEDAAVATVTEDAGDDRQATITSVGDGTTRVIATVGSTADTVEVTVAQAVDSVAITSPRVSFTALGQTTTLAAQALDANGQAAPGVAAWAALAPDTATIDAVTGVATAVVNGTAVFTATVGAVVDTITLTVQQVAASISVAPNPVPDTLTSGDTQQFTASAEDSLGVAIAVPAFLWASSNEEAATIDGDGLATAQTVTALDCTLVSATSGAATDEVELCVVAATLTSVAIVPAADTIDAIGGTVTLAAQGLNQNDNPIPGETFTWATLDPGVASVSTSGVVTAVANGTARIEVTSLSDPSLKDTANVLVQQKVVTVTVSPASHTFNALTRTEQFTATARDSKGVTVAGAAFTWTDETGGIISVDNSGLVTADAAGSTKVIAASEGVQGTADVTVRQVPGAITTAPTHDTVAVGGTITLTATVTDSAGQPIPGAGVTWESLGTSFATVSAAGVVTGVASTDSVAVRAEPTGFTTIRDTTQITVQAFVLEFDGDDYASAGDNLDLDDLHLPIGWTIEAWVKPATAMGTQYVLNKGNIGQGNNDASYGLYLNAGVPTVYIRNTNGGSGTAVQTLAATAPISTGVWHHLAVSFDNTTYHAKLYVDGDSVGEFTFAGDPHDKAGALVLGAQTTAGGSGLNGSIDELRFWSTVRTSAEIAGAYKSPLAGNETGLLAWWPFNAGTGNPVDQLGGITTFTLGAATNDPVWVSESPTFP